MSLQSFLKFSRVERLLVDEPGTLLALILVDAARPLLLQGLGVRTASSVNKVKRDVGRGQLVEHVAKGQAFQFGPAGNQPIPGRMDRTGVHGQPGGLDGLGKRISGQRRIRPGVLRGRADLFRRELLVRGKIMVKHTGQRKQRASDHLVFPVHVGILATAFAVFSQDVVARNLDALHAVGHTGRGPAEAESLRSILREGGQKMQGDLRVAVIKKVVDAHVGRDIGGLQLVIQAALDCMRQIGEHPAPCRLEGVGRQDCIHHVLDGQVTLDGQVGAALGKEHVLDEHVLGRLHELVLRLLALRVLGVLVARLHGVSLVNRLVNHLSAVELGLRVNLLLHAHSFLDDGIQGRLGHHHQAVHDVWGNRVGNAGTLQLVFEDVQKPAMNPSDLVGRAVFVQLTGLCQKFPHFLVTPEGRRDVGESKLHGPVFLQVRRSVPDGQHLFIAVAVVGDKPALAGGVFDDFGIHRTGEPGLAVAFENAVHLDLSADRLLTVQDVVVLEHAELAIVEARCSGHKPPEIGHHSQILRGDVFEGVELHRPALRVAITDVVEGDAVAVHLGAQKRVSLDGLAANGTSVAAADKEEFLRLAVIEHAARAESAQADKAAVGRDEVTDLAAREERAGARIDAQFHLLEERELLKRLDLPGLEFTGDGIERLALAGHESSVGQKTQSICGYPRVGRLIHSSLGIAQAKANQAQEDLLGVQLRHRAVRLGLGLQGFGDGLHALNFAAGHRREEARGHCDVCAQFLGEGVESLRNVPMELRILRVRSLFVVSQVGRILLARPAGPRGPHFCGISLSDGAGSDKTAKRAFERRDHPGAEVCQRRSFDGTGSGDHLHRLGSRFHMTRPGDGGGQHGVALHLLGQTILLHQLVDDGLLGFLVFRESFDENGCVLRRDHAGKVAGKIQGREIGDHPGELLAPGLAGAAGIGPGRRESANHLGKQVLGVGGEIAVDAVGIHGPAHRGDVLVNVGLGACEPTKIRVGHGYQMPVLPRIKLRQRDALHPGNESILAKKPAVSD